MLTGELDRESIPSYNSIILRISDKGNPTLFSDVEIRVDAQDVNEFNPVFGNGPFNVSVDENTKNVVVISVPATDGDAAGSPFGQIVYEITDGERKEDFEIDPVSFF